MVKNDALDSVVLITSLGVVFSVYDHMKSDPAGTIVGLPKGAKI
jgi:hypothetical protein